MGFAYICKLHVLSMGVHINEEISFVLSLQIYTQAPVSWFVLQSRCILRFRPNELAGLSSLNPNLWWLPKVDIVERIRLKKKAAIVLKWSIVMRIIASSWIFLFYFSRRIRTRLLETFFLYSISCLVNCVVSSSNISVNIWKEEKKGKKDLYFRVVSIWHVPACNLYNCNTN